MEKKYLKVLGAVVAITTGGGAPDANAQSATCDKAQIYSACGIGDPTMECTDFGGDAWSCVANEYLTCGGPGITLQEARYNACIALQSFYNLTTNGGPCYYPVRADICLLCNTATDVSPSPVNLGPIICPYEALPPKLKQTKSNPIHKRR